ncbi:protein of unknown function [Paenibacillus alvei]|uniref:Uncharacterized protein n=1 Tax=Paenibacillus alvei TaxID=44250 RepID=A0A383RG31_PAEAL|nr:protein of unknown function [Paenibacillus alvei]
MQSDLIEMEKIDVNISKDANKRGCLIVQVKQYSGGKRGNEENECCTFGQLQA